MAYNVSTPDMDNYIKRIVEIQKDIEPRATASYTPRTGGANPPYWLTLARNVAITPINETDSRLTLVADMLLIRGGARSGYDGQIEFGIFSDLVNVVSYFARYRNLISTAYPAIQPYYVPDSAQLTRVERFEGAIQGDASIIGSFYTLQWQHRLVKTDTDISPP